MIWVLYHIKYLFSILFNTFQYNVFDFLLVICYYLL
nr:MAG TPA: hypothetical protein [Bacteriophage sp.]DAQ98132.1 MAG TPA: hypothetical protein [Caudoviricetes sp.]